MATFLFDKIVFGPVNSRRLGTSLGINLLPAEKKLCNFDCVYCECGWSHIHKIKRSDLPSREEVRNELIRVLTEMRSKGLEPDVITYAGNGEPTMHPEFEYIAEDIYNIRNELIPGCRISLLCNSSLLHKKQIIRSLSFIDQNILKLDTAIEESFIRINKPDRGIKLEKIIHELEKIEVPITIQTLFLRGKGSLAGIDNTTEEEISALLEAYRRIDPEAIMVYSFYRDTPTADLEMIQKEELSRIANRIEKEGFRVELTG